MQSATRLSLRGDPAHLEGSTTAAGPVEQPQDAPAPLPEQPPIGRVIKVPAGADEAAFLDTATRLSGRVPEPTEAEVAQGADGLVAFEARLSEAALTLEEWARVVWPVLRERPAYKEGALATVATWIGATEE